MITQKAGTILLNIKTKKVGLIFRKTLNDYTFPKGHLEQGETLQECAIRETEEETLRANHLLINEEIYTEKYITPSGEKVENHLYIAIDDGPTSKNIAIEDREELIWVDPTEVLELLTYEDLKKIWEEIYPKIFEILGL